MPGSFTIKDRDDRTWGTFDVMGEEDGKTHGYLKQTLLSRVSILVFLAHARALALPHGDADATASNILMLGAYLVDDVSGQRVDIHNIIF